MKLVNEQLKNLKIMIGKDIETVGADGSLEVDDSQTEVIESLLASGFVCLEPKAKAAKAAKGAKTKAEPKEETEETKEVLEEKAYKTVGKDKEKPANRFQRS